MTTIFDIILLAAVVFCALLAVTLGPRESAVAVFLVFGIALAVLWARLDAPDIALAEAALGGGVAGALLVDALTSRRIRPPNAPPPWPLIALGLTAGAAAMTALLAVVSDLPREPGPLPALVDSALDASGSEHAVTSVLLNFRSYDTLLEVAVLVVAAIGAGAMVRSPIHTPRTPSPVIRATIMVLLPLIFLLAVWLLVAGTSRPGGAFQSGAVLGAGLVIAHLTGVPMATPRLSRALALVLVGLVAFLALAGFTAAAGRGWLVLDDAWASWAILGIESVLVLSIGVGLAFIFIANRADAESAVVGGGRR